MESVRKMGGVHLKIDVTELMNHRLDAIKFDYTFDLGHTDICCVDLPEDVTIRENGIHVSGVAEDSFGCMMMKAHVTVAYTTMCARCLEDVESSLEFDLERMIMTERLAETSSYTDDGEWNGETDDVIYVTDASIIPDADIVEQISLELPMFVLCSEDCPGLCPRCGKPLRNGDCGCKEEKTINPKLAILQKLLDNQE